MGIRELALDGTVVPGPAVAGGMVGRGNMPVGWANTLAHQAIYNWSGKGALLRLL